MKRTLFFSAVCAALALSAAATAAEPSLDEGFAEPPATARARTWWHWIDGNVTREGITADLEAMRRVGIHEAQIFNVDQGYPDGPLVFMSPEWLEMFRFAVTEAERLGLEIGFNNGSGWSSSGGPWITPEFGMQRVVYTLSECTGGGRVRLTLPQPETKLGFYRDIAVLAFPTPEDDTRVDNLAQKSLSTDSFTNRLLPDAKPVPAGAVVPCSAVVDLTAAMSADGTLSWKAPKGRWTILRIGHTPTGTENRPAGERTGQGLECDKMSRAAVDAYWKGGIEPILEKVGPLAGRSLTNCLIDSYEVGCGNWTEGFDREFARLRGYDCRRYLPALAGFYVGSGEQTERFLWDFRQTVGDLMADNYFGYFAELCHRHGLLFSVEPYGGPFDCLRAGASSDVPMSEFWVGGKVYREMSKLAASVAHLNGTPFVGAEAFTADGAHSRWLNQPATMKALGDWAWSEGVNRFIFHTYAHQPWDVAPGMTFHMYGTEISRLNTWWEPGRAYMDYLARSQFLLQSGRCAADVLVFTGESSPNDGIYRGDLKAAGYDYDLIGADDLASLSVRDGRIVTPAGGEYRLLVLPDADRMTPGTLECLRRLTGQGAVVVGPKPVASPSLSGYPRCDERVARLSGELWGDASAPGPIRDIPASEALRALNLAPDFSGGADLPYIHRITPEADIYFLSNQQRQYRTDTCRFRIAGRCPERWNAETGERTPLAVWWTEDDLTVVPLDFEPEEACFIVFREPAEGADPVVSCRQSAPSERRPLRGLEIIRAEYGHFLPEGMADVTGTVGSREAGGRLELVASNDLAGDPAPGAVKELRVKYRAGDRVYRVWVPESQRMTIPQPGQTGEFRLLQALYGRFAPDFDDNLPAPPADIAELVRQKIAGGEPVFRVDDALAGGSAAGTEPGKKLRLVYSVEGEVYDETYPVGRRVDLSFHEPEARLLLENGRPVWMAPRAGEVVCRTASGRELKGAVHDVPRPIDLSEGWDVDFPDERIASPVRFGELVSWTERDDDAIRHFSGTAVYRKTFTLPEELLGVDRSLELDLGRVRVMAEVIVNGRNLGVVWKAPFTLDMGDALRTGENTLEIRVTNLWPNRLIGDERYPDDCLRNEWLPTAWPEWLTEGGERPSQRTTFSTWKHWHAGDSLLPSGMTGPVLLRSYVRVPLAE